MMSEIEVRIREALAQVITEENIKLWSKKFIEDKSYDVGPLVHFTVWHDDDEEFGDRVTIFPLNDAVRSVSFNKYESPAKVINFFMAYLREPITESCKVTRAHTEILYNALLHVNPHRMKNVYFPYIKGTEIMALDTELFMIKDSNGVHIVPSLYVDEFGRDLFINKEFFSKITWLDVIEFMNEER